MDYVEVPLLEALVEPQEEGSRHTPVGPRKDKSLQSPDLDAIDLISRGLAAGGVRYQHQLYSEPAQGLAELHGRCRRSPNSRIDFVGRQCHSHGDLAVTVVTSLINDMRRVTLTEAPSREVHAP